MKDMDIINFVINNKDNGMCYQEIADALKISDHISLSKPAIMRIYKTHRIGKEISKTLNLDPSAKILRDRARRKAQREELLTLRVQYDALYRQFYAHGRDACKCAYCETARAAISLSHR